MVTVLAALIGWQLNRRVKAAERKAVAAQEKAVEAQEKAEDAQDTINLRDQVEATEESTEEEEPAPPGINDPYRALAQQVFDDALAFIAQEMEKADGRHKRTYKNIAGASLPIKAAAMHKRNDLSTHQYEAAVALAHEWNQYWRGKASKKIVPEPTLRRMQSLLRKLKER
jgi:hypothetical protein